MIRRFAVTVVAVLAAAGLALVARGAFALDRSLRAGEQPHGVAAGLASSLTGTRQQRELREALVLLRKRNSTIAATLSRFRRAALLLAGPAARSDARAANLLGVISAEEAMAVKEHAAASFGAARAEFAAAIRADPTDENAKHNLELLLAQQSSQRQQQDRRGGGSRKKGTGHSPAGSGF